MYITVTELKVSNPALTTRSETFLEIEWTVTEATGAIEEFRYQVGSGAVISVNKETTANITGLIPGNMYTIKIISVDKNSAPTEQTTYVQISFATKPAVPGPIDLVNSDLTASDGQIIIRWKSSGTVMFYTVTISELVTNPTVVNNPFYITRGNVAKNGYRYTLTVKANSNSLESGEYIEKFRTVITQPNPPTVQSTCLEDDSKSTSIYVRWQAPTYPNGDILYYLVDTVFGPTTVPQFNTSINVLDQKVGPLLEESLYCFRVKSVNDGPDKIRTSDLAINSNVASQGQDLILRKCATHKILIKEYRNSTELMSSMSYEIDQLLPYTDYDVWINAINAAGDGDRNETSVQTDSEVPQKPLSVVASVVSSSEITITWNQPSPRPGVTTYHVEAYEVVLNAQPTFVKFSNLTGFSPQTSTFSGLEAYWNFTFSVVAATDKGNSEQSDMSGRVTTRQDAPGKVTNFEITIPANTLTTMQVSWAIPLLRDRNGIIKEYRISHNISGTTTLETITAEFEIFQKLYYITPDRHYKVELYAVNTINQIGQKEQMIFHAIPKNERPRQEHDESQHGDQYEDLGMDNISSYQGTKDIPNVYDQIGRVQTIDKHYENMLP
ncbi:unnamed protein product [Mytilus edulis]|uniref:Fibronectin type-III domain-containing protein n=1 Tax=Mytilus edulis TaxID=6550 RepID=A0A8S3R0G7_MYTED|nr:unnamed protein product [Mytilus edulis]